MHRWKVPVQELVSSPDLHKKSGVSGFCLLVHLAVSHVISSHHVPQKGYGVDRVVK